MSLDRRSVWMAALRSSDGAVNKEESLFSMVLCGELGRHHEKELVLLREI